MSYQFIVGLPKHLEAAYKAGEIIITGGVARYADSMAIAAHLEQAAPFAAGAFNTNPYLAMASTALQTARVAKGMVVDTAKLNQIIALTQQIQTLSSINLAISGATLGVAVVGIAIVLHQLNKLNQKLDRLSAQLQSLDMKISEVHKNELSKLIEKVKIHIKHCISFINQIEDLGWSHHLDTEIVKQLDSAETLMERVLAKYLDRDGINISLDLVQCLYSSYANLLKVYLTNRYLSQKSLDYLGLRLKTLENFSSQLSSPEMIDELYESLLLNQERRFSEGELDVILELYRYGCKNKSQDVNVHYEILTKTPLKEFQNWQRLLAESKKPLIWIEHAT
ncbi:hypothetical protein [Almyronema epifaneia]|uniref:Uncharacterized protein n=1 Tax=Almyronema epifaneia S1 TaxID=2991925 RepID=A0ABW6IIQ6_9CYAN